MKYLLIGAAFSAALYLYVQNKNLKSEIALSSENLISATYLKSSKAKVYYFKRPIGNVERWRAILINKFGTCWSDPPDGTGVLVCISSKRS